MSDYNPLDQDKQLPKFTELEQLQEDYSELRNKLKEAKKRMTFCIDLAELGTNNLLITHLKNIRL